jgi:short-subunit dehydrogenase
LALITGASSGIGEAIADELARRGHDLVLTARSRPALESLARRLAAAHRINTTVIDTDLAQPDAPQRLVAELVGRSLSPDVLVNNAGFGCNDRFWSAPLRRQLDMIQLNTAALTELTHHLLPPMIQRRRGRVLNVTSIAAFLPGPYQAVYFATKAYVLSFSVALNEELRGSGVSITALCPGPVKTKFADAAGFTNTKLFDGPATLSPEAVARIGVNAALAGRPIAVAGFINRLNVWGTRLLSRPMAALIAKSLQTPKNLAPFA